MSLQPKLPNVPDQPPGYELSPDQRASMEDEGRPLPDGWVRDFDRNSNHHFYVDTRAKPPRSTWVHPWEDPQWQKENPEEYERRNIHNFSPPYSAPPASGSGGGSHGVAAGSSSTTGKAGGAGKPQKKNVFERVFGTKEERAEAKRARDAAERERQQRYVMHRKQLLEQQRARQALYSQQYGYAQPSGLYGPPAGAYMGRRRGGLGGGGMAMPIMGGLAGGMLLGGMMDGGDGFGGGGFGDGGGGGFDGGGGGDFGGGGF